ncbi:MAG TPA: flagellar biosynthetic protein FliO [Gammaproteobacteria bacterium]|nr:flagellar biosynthetic protein FliO [Gammaproteobacteria bacterium]
MIQKFRSSSPYLPLLLLLLPSTQVCAEEVAVGKLAYQPLELASLTNVATALILVLVAIVGSMWLIKKLSGMRYVQGGRISVTSGLNLGPKEKIVLINCADKQILVGVTANSIQTLHVFAEDEIAAPDPEQSVEMHPFAERLGKMLKQRTLG